MPARPLSSGASLGAYEVIRPIEDGGADGMYEARHRALDQDVAIQVIHRLAGDGAMSKARTIRWLREARAATRVLHPHVIPVIDVGVTEHGPFIVREHTQGETLDQRIAVEGVVSLPALVEILLPIVSAVRELHASGIVHGGLTPASIVLLSDDTGEVCPKVTGFGAPRIHAEARTEGTLEYMAPEQAIGADEATERSDQYALAAILYRCTTGRMPFVGDAPYGLVHAIAHGRVMPPSEARSELPRSFDDVVLRAMSRDPAARFASVEELGAALLAFATREVAARWAHAFRPRPPDAVAEVTSVPPLTSSPLAAASRAPMPRAAVLLAAAIALPIVGAIAMVISLRRGPASEPATLPASAAEPVASPNLQAARVSVHEREMAAASDAGTAAARDANMP